MAVRVLSYPWTARSWESCLLVSQGWGWDGDSDPSLSASPTPRPLQVSGDDSCQRLLPSPRVLGKAVASWTVPSLHSGVGHSSYIRRNIRTGRGWRCHVECGVLSRNPLPPEPPSSPAFLHPHSSFFGAFPSPASQILLFKCPSTQDSEGKPVWYQGEPRPPSPRV